MQFPKITGEGGFRNSSPLTYVGWGRHLTEGVKLGKILPIRVELKSS